METRQLGTSELATSVIGLGCWPLGGGPGWGDQDERKSIATVHAALDSGINFFDSAEGYNDGASEYVLGKALVGRRDKALIATKISPGNTAPRTLREHCEASLVRLQTDHIDLYQVHWPIDHDLVQQAFDTLEQLHSEGKVRVIGVSNHAVGRMHEALRSSATIASNQLCYSLMSRAIETEIIPTCIEHGIGVIAYMALMQGVLAGIYETADNVPPFRARTRHFDGKRPGSRHGEAGAEAEVFATLDRLRQVAGDLGVPMTHVALAWVAAKPGVSCVLLGGRKPEQLARNVGAAELVLSPETVSLLDDITEPVRTKLGPNADYFEGAEKNRTL